MWITDVEIHHLETAKELKFSDISITAQGPLRASVNAQVKYGKSTINVTVSYKTYFLLQSANRCSQISLDAITGQ